MRYSILLALGLLLAHIPLESRAGSFSIVGQDKSWDYVPGAATFNYLVGIENRTGNSELLLLWSLNLTIRPASAQTTGELIRKEQNGIGNP